MSSYPVMPGARFAYDVDGTLVLRTTETNMWQEWSEANKRIINTIDYRMVYFPSLLSGATKIAFVFPEARDIEGAFIAAAWADSSSSFHYQIGVGYPIVCEYSTDTTSGADGEWFTTTFVDANPLSSDYVPIPASFYSSVAVGEPASFSFLSSYLANPATPYYRSRAKAPESPMTGVRGLRLWLGKNGIISTSTQYRMAVQTVHLYGNTSNSTGLDRVDFWRASSDAPLQLVDTDFGDVEVSGSYTRSFRLKNRSSSRTAVNVSVFLTRDTVYTDLSNFFDFKYLGTYWASVVIPSIDPGAVSPIIEVRGRIPYSAILSTWSMRVGMSIGGWQ